MNSRKILFSIGGFFILLLILSFPKFFPSSEKRWIDHKTPEQQEMPSLILSGQSIEIELAKTNEERTRGLSGRTVLPQGKGMLFLFDQDGYYPFWMPEMHFAIDILWLNSAWEIVHIEKTVTPESYPKTFASPRLARFVLEIPSGTVDALGTKIGEKIRFSEGKP